MRELEQLLDRLSEGRAQRLSLSGLIGGWENLVANIEASYDWSVYEYTNDLAVRIHLERVLAEGLPATGWLREQVAPLDQRFIATTTEYAGELPGLSRAMPAGDLLHRVPVNPGPDLAGDLESEQRTLVLFRPVGENELALIEQSDWRRFPPRLPEQPIFYPVLSEAYARRIANEWNTQDGGVGHVTRFEVDLDFAVRYPPQAVGGDRLRELWVPAEELETFNDHIVGRIEVVATFPPPV